MKKLVTLLTALMVNVMVGALVGTVVGAPIVGSCVGLILPCFLGNFMPAGSLYAGVLTEVWTGELIKALRAANNKSFLQGVPDYSQYADSDVIHLVDVGADPDVLINNTTYPIDVAALSDTNVSISLDKFQTKATPVTDDELYALSYDKIASVKERHVEALATAHCKKAIHAFAPASNTTNTPVLVTTGADEGTGRLRLIRADIIALKAKFDTLEVPIEGRRLVLCPDHVNDLLLTDQTFQNQYYNYQTGAITKMYGFEIFEYVATPYYTSAGNKKAYGVSAASTDRQASVAFYIKNMFKAEGSTKMYYSEAKNDPLNQRNLINYRNYFIALPKTSKYVGAIYSGTAANNG